MRFYGVNHINTLATYSTQLFREDNDARNGIAGKDADESQAKGGRTVLLTYRIFASMMRFNLNFRASYPGFGAFVNNNNRIQVLSCMHVLSAYTFIQNNVRVW